MMKAIETIADAAYLAADADVDTDNLGAYRAARETGMSQGFEEDQFITFYMRRVRERGVTLRSIY